MTAAACSVLIPAAVTILTIIAVTALYPRLRRAQPRYRTVVLRAPHRWAEPRTLGRHIDVEA